MFALHAKPLIEEYIAYMGQGCTLNGATVTVSSYTNNSRSGSYAQGFTFGSNTYGFLIRRLAAGRGYTPLRFSPDHGATWYETLAEAKKQRVGKVKLSRTSSKEFAYYATQTINKDYDSNYRGKA